MSFSCLPLLYWFLSRIVEGKFDTNFASIFAFERQLMPDVALTSSKLDNISKIDPGLPNKVSSFVVIEDGTLELVIVWRVVNGKTELLIPATSQN